MGLSKKRYAIAFLTPFVIVVISKIGISFQSRPLNFCAIFAALAGYVYFAAASFAIRPKVLGIVVGGTLIAPIVVAVVTFPIAMLGWMFVLDDIAAPYKMEEVRNGVLCRVRGYGMAVSDEGTQVELVRPVLGFVYRTDFSALISDAHDDGSHETPCQFAFHRANMN